MDHEVKEEILILKNMIRKWNREYYVISLPSVDDCTYDSCLLRLQYLENKYPEYKTLDSPTLKFGSDLLNDFKEVAHDIPILSLNKAYNFQDLKSWINKIDFNHSCNISIEPKIDGCSIVFYYKSGFLEKVLTRGNGKFGNDITDNARTIKHIPLVLDEEIDLILRGEVYITKKNFFEINKVLEKPYSNSRNLTSGILRRVNSKEVSTFPLDVFVYDFLSSSLDIKTSDLAIDKLKKLGFKINPLMKFFDQRGLEQDIINYIENIIDQRDSFEYEIDGVVLKVRDFALREKLGYTSHHPKWAIAYKFESHTDVSRVNNIYVQVGRSGKITPVAEIDKIFVSGAFITHATLHNQDYIISINLNIGDIVSVSRRGDVIPAVEAVIEKVSTGYFKLPNHCPSCGTILMVEGAHYFCKNRRCSERTVESIKYFCGKKCMNIEGLSEKTISFLFEKKLIFSEADLYTFDFNRLLEFKGFKAKKISNLANSIENSKKNPFSKLLLSLGIKELGENTITLLFVNGFNSFSKIFDLCKDKKSALYRLLKIKGIGEKIALSIIEAFNDEVILNKFKFFDNLGFKMHENTEIDFKDEFLFGKKFCITGTFSGYSRINIIENMKIRGAIFNTSVTKSLDFLLVGGVGVGGRKVGSKLKKAWDLNIKIVNFEDIKDYLDLN